MSASVIPRIAIHVQHLQGSGHLVRALSLGRALKEKGMRVCVLSGGKPTQHDTSMTEFVQLPSLHSSPGDFSDLRDENNKSITDAWRQRRLHATLAALEAFQPDVLITELFPFGRRQLQFELFPVLEHLCNSKRAPHIVCSIRDVLQRRKISREQETIAILNKYFDNVLVHSDIQYLPLSYTFQQTAAINIPIVYTGYIHSISSDESTNASVNHRSKAVNGVVVSAGSSAAGLPLLRCALGAKKLSNQNNKPWLIRVGHAVEQEDFYALCKQADSCTTIERNQPGFLNTLRQYAVSVSLCGYNTSLDLLLAGTPCVLVPFEGHGESEQRDRAEALSRLSHIDVLYERDLNAKTLARAVDHVATQPRDSFALPNLEGLAGSVAAINQLLESNANGRK